MISLSEDGLEAKHFNSNPNDTEAAGVYSNTKLDNATVKAGEELTLTAIERSRSTSTAAPPIQIQFLPQTFDKNFIRSIDILSEGITTPEEAENAAVGKSITKYNFFDDLGRPIQSVTKQGSPLQKDIVQPIVYDQFGREARKYLPYVSGDDGWYKYDPVGEISKNYDESPHHNFYNMGGDNIANDAQPYAQSIFEPSPLSRVLKQGSPGAVWQPDEDLAADDRSVKFDYRPNVAGEVLMWEVVDGHCKLSSRHYYDEGELYVTETKDENWTTADGNNGVIREYKDKQGRIILKRTYNLDQPHDTYYVYDDESNLRFVIPPEAIRQLGNRLTQIDESGDATVATSNLTLRGASAKKYYYCPGVAVTLAPEFRGTDGFEVIPYPLDIELVNEYLFVYQYNDKRNRMTEKKVPGADPVYMIYDDRDRLVLTQDGNQRDSLQWTFTKYDAFNRPVSTGIYTHSDETSQVAMQQYFDDKVKSIANLYEIFNGSSGNHGYSNDIFPTENIDVLTVTYYDNYAFVGADYFDAEGLDFSYKSDIATEIPYPDAEFQPVKSQVTGGKVKELNSSANGSKYMNAVTYYDDRYRVVQSVSKNYLDRLEIVTNCYDDLSNKIKESVNITEAPEPVKVHMKFIYDHAQRLEEIQHSVNDGQFVILESNEYNELGELVEKNLHSPDQGSSFAQSVDYRYNIRGWLTKINDATLSDGEKDYFGMELAYNDDFGSDNTPLYNGNISVIKWSADFAGDQRLYNYQYDRMNRLTGANYKANKGEGWIEDVGRFDMSATFDRNGNLQALTRYNEINDPMDDLQYAYQGNKLLYISDVGNRNKGFLEGNTHTDDFIYDANGNLTMDKNKGIVDMRYNYLDLAEKIESENGSYVKYIYDSNGKKLAEEVYDRDGQLEKRTDYVGKLTYVNNELKYINHKEGQILIDDLQELEYRYDLKDHLGNTRISFTTKRDIDTLTATFEEDLFLDETSNFNNYSRISNDLFDHTDAGTDYTYSQLLTGASNSIVGLAKEIEVIQGDTIQAEVFAKYFNPTNTDSDVAVGLAGAVASTFGAPPATSGEASALGAINDLFGAGSILAAGNDWTSSDAPKAYLNAIVFDKDYNVLKLAFDRIDVGAEQPIGDLTKYPHDRLSLELAIDQPGYVYLYVSNETPKLVDVYFDDMQILHHRSPIVQQDDYYPYGMSIAETALQKDNPFYTGASFANRFGYQDLGFRRYDPSAGRFFSIDPLAELQLDQSTYQYAANNPVKNIDELGLGPFDWLLDLFRSKEQKVRRDRELTKKGKRKHHKYDNRGNRKERTGGKVKADDENNSDEDNTSGEANSTGKDNSTGDDNGSDKSNGSSSKDDNKFNSSQEGDNRLKDERKDFVLKETINNNQLAPSEPDIVIPETKQIGQNPNSKTLPERVNDRYKNPGSESPREHYEQTVRESGSKNALVFDRLYDRRDVSDKIVADQNDLGGWTSKPAETATLLDDIKNAVAASSSSLNITPNLMYLEGKYEKPISLTPKAARLLLDSKTIDVMVQVNGNLVIDDIFIDPQSVETYDENFAFSSLGDYITYEFSYPGQYHKLRITVRKEDAYDFEEYMGIKHSIDYILDEPGPFAVEKIKEARELIEEIEDEEAKGDAYEKLQVKVEYANQRITYEGYRYTSSKKKSNIADYMCNLTSLSRTFELLGIDKSGFKSILGSDYDETKPFGHILEIVRGKKYKGNARTSYLTRKKIASLVGVEQEYQDKISIAENKQWFDDNILNHLKSGDGVLISFGGHIVRLERITEKGLIVDDPFGTLSDFKKRYEEESDHWDNVNAKDDMDSDVGNSVTWEWSDIRQVEIKYIEIYSKKNN